MFDISKWPKNKPANVNEVDILVAEDVIYVMRFTIK